MNSYNTLAVSIVYWQTICSSLQAPRPSTGPHKLRECLPLIVFLRNRLKYALSYDEVKKILKQRLIKVDGKIRTDVTYPAGFMGENSLYQLHNPNVWNSHFFACSHQTSWLKPQSLLLNYKQDRFLSNYQVLPVVKLTGITSQKDFLNIIMQRTEHCS